MNTKTHTFLWTAFWTFSFLTLLVDLVPWMMELRSTVRFVFAIISIVLGLSILVVNERTIRSVALVVAGFIVGQWWLIKLLAVVITWSIGGFAP